MPAKRTKPKESSDSIASRLQSERISERFTQEELASETGTGRAAYSNYELGRVRLPFGVAWAICHRLDLNPRWLLTGTEPKRPFVSADELRILEARLNEVASMDFESGYREVLDGPLERWFASHGNEEIVKRMLKGGPQAVARRASYEELELSFLDRVAAFRAAKPEHKLAHLEVIKAFFDELRTRLQNKYRY